MNLRSRVKVERYIQREYPTSYNTALPATFLAALVTSPNPWPVTLFAEGRKQCARPAGSATRNVMRKQQKTKKRHKGKEGAFRSFRAAVLDRNSYHKAYWQVEAKAIEAKADRSKGR
jgi:hypothetical protein